VRFGIKRIG